MRGRPWPESEVSLLQRYLDLQMPYSAIARELGRSEMAIRQKVSHLRWASLHEPKKKTAHRRGPQVAATRIACWELRKAGLSATQAAAILGVTKNVVIGHWFRARHAAGASTSTGE